VGDGFRSWYMSDPKAASDWMRSAKLEPWLDPAVSTFALHRVRESPEEALEWTQRVGDQRLREQTLVKFVLIWMMHHPDDAQAWLDRAELPDGVRQAIAQAREKSARRRGLGAPAEAPQQPWVADPEVPAAGAGALAPEAAPEQR
jgi:hypothetical protein